MSGNRFSSLVHDDKKAARLASPSTVINFIAILFLFVLVVGLKLFGDSIGITETTETPMLSAHTPAAVEQPAVAATPEDTAVSPADTPATEDASASAPAGTPDGAPVATTPPAPPLSTPQPDTAPSVEAPTVATVPVSTSSPAPVTVTSSTPSPAPVTVTSSTPATAPNPVTVPAPAQTVTQTLPPSAPAPAAVAPVITVRIETPAGMAITPDMVKVSANLPVTVDTAISPTPLTAKKKPVARANRPARSELPVDFLDGESARQEYLAANKISSPRSNDHVK